MLSLIPSLVVNPSLLWKGIEELSWKSEVPEARQRKPHTCEFVWAWASTFSIWPPWLTLWGWVGDLMENWTAPARLVPKPEIPEGVWASLVYFPIWSPGLSLGVGLGTWSGKVKCLRQGRKNTHLRIGLGMGFHIFHLGPLAYSLGLGCHLSSGMPSQLLKCLRG